jgi:hypothetical protein
VKAKVGQMCREGLLGSEWAPGLVSRRFTPADAIPISITFDKKTPGLAIATQQDLMVTTPVVGN